MIMFRNFCIVGMIACVLVAFGITVYTVATPIPCPEADKVASPVTEDFVDYGFMCMQTVTGVAFGPTTAGGVVNTNNFPAEGKMLRVMARQDVIVGVSAGGRMRVNDQYVQSYALTFHDKGAVREIYFLPIDLDTTDKPQIIFTPAKEEK